MATYYVGVGGSNANNGTSYALRKLTLNGAEDIPVAANDTVIVAPGVYRELLTIDVSGTAGNPITYIADVDGHLTDGVGGPVRITGSDNDTTQARANCITATSKDYRTFRGFWMGQTSSNMLTLITACGNWIVEDCQFADMPAGISIANIAGTGTTNTFRRCLFMPTGGGSAITFTHTSVVDNSAHLVENCIFIGGSDSNGCIRVVRVGGFAVKHCTFMGVTAAIRVTTAITVGQLITCNNNMLINCTTGFSGTVSGEIIEDYNTLYGVSTARSNTATGTNSVAYPAIFLPPLLLATFKYPWAFGDLSMYSQVRRIAGTSMSADDMLGITRPVTDAKKSWGALQYMDRDRETTTKRTGAASIKLADAGRVQMFVPTSNVSTVFSVYVQYEANYAGTLPSMIIRQPGQSSTTVTAVGASGSWELLTTTLTPAASPGYCVIDLRSTNTASGASIACFFDDLTVA